MTRFRPEPAPPSVVAGRAAETAVLLVNLGTPAAPTPAALRRYLAEFLSDPRVVEIARPLWWPVLHGVILRVRPARSAAKYRSVWTPEGSPLAVWTARQGQALQQRLQALGLQLPVRCAMRYGAPALPEQLDALRAQGATRILVVPLYPQYAGATTGSVADAVHRWALRARRVPELRSVADYHDDPGYIEALAASLQRHWREHAPGERLVLSFHGIPARSVRLGDPYRDQCQATAQRLRQRLGLGQERVLLTFQSRFGKARWLEPYTEPTVRALAAQGVRRIDVACPGFAADCLETLEEIGVELRAAFLQAGGEGFSYIPCLNADTAWIDALSALVQRHLRGWVEVDTAGATAAA